MAKQPLELEMSNTLRDCRLAEIHALVIVSGAGDIAAPFTKIHILDPEETDDKPDAEPDDIYSYLPRVINGPEAAELPDRREKSVAHNWPFPETNSLFLTASTGMARS